MHCYHIRTPRGTAARADLIIRLFVECLRQGVADIKSRAPRSASWALSERYQQGVVPRSRRRHKVGNLLATCVGGGAGRWKAASRCSLSVSGINYSAGIQAVGAVNVSGVNACRQAAQESGDKLAVTAIMESVHGENIVVPELMLYAQSELLNVRRVGFVIDDINSDSERAGAACEWVG